MARVLQLQTYIVKVTDMTKSLSGGELSYISCSHGPCIYFEEQNLSGELAPSVSVPELAMFPN